MVPTGLSSAACRRRGRPRSRNTPGLPRLRRCPLNPPSPPSHHHPPQQTLADDVTGPARLSQWRARRSRCLRQPQDGGCLGRPGAEAAGPGGAPGAGRLPHGLGASRSAVAGPAVPSSPPEAALPAASPILRPLGALPACPRRVTAPGVREQPRGPLKQPSEGNKNEPSTAVRGPDAHWEHFVELVVLASPPAMLAPKECGFLAAVRGHSAQSWGLGKLTSLGDPGLGAVWLWSTSPL